MVARFERECLRAGLDLVHAFAVSDYNQAVAAQERVPSFGRERALAILVGNTRALWASFSAACRRDAALAQAAHPLDEYASSTIERAITTLKRFKKKFEKTGVLRSLRSRTAFQKPSISRRKDVIRAAYKEKMYGNHTQQ